jgi:hypothetical protein
VIDARQRTPLQSAGGNAIGGDVQSAGDVKQGLLGWAKVLDDVKKRRVVVVTTGSDSGQEAEP